MVLTRPLLAVPIVAVSALQEALVKLVLLAASVREGFTALKTTIEMILVQVRLLHLTSSLIYFDWSMALAM